MPFLSPGKSSNLRLTLRIARAWLLKQIAGLDPEGFALVMATGIISNALYLEGYHRLSGLLFTFNALAYLWLALLTLLRAIWFPQAIWVDLTSPQRVFAFFTLVAANGVFGAGLKLRGAGLEALDLWILALIAWLILIYFSLGVLTVRNSAGGAGVMRGGWLLAIVGTQSVVILGTLIAPPAGELNSAVLVFVNMLWAIGVGLYGIIAALLAYRIFFFEVAAREMRPGLWVIMGAAAISTNAGSELTDANAALPSLNSMRPFVEGVTVSLWAWATWWIPLLALFGIWKHAVRRVPLNFTAGLWSAVFPLGMYSAASLRLSLAADFPSLRAISLVMMWVSVAAWAATLTGLAVSCLRSFRNFKRSPGLRVF
jgi:tellurite resistance protein TehA-like permease